MKSSRHSTFPYIKKRNFFTQFSLPLIYQNWAICSSLNKWKEEWDSLFKTHPDSFFRARIWVTFFIPRDLCLLSVQINSVNKEQVGGRALKYGCWVDSKDWLPSKQKTLHVWVCVVWLYMHAENMEGYKPSCWHMLPHSWERSPNVDMWMKAGEDESKKKKNVSEKYIDHMYAFI